MSASAAASLLILMSSAPAAAGDPAAFQGLEWGSFSLQTWRGRAPDRAVTVRILQGRGTAGTRWAAEMVERHGTGPERRAWTDGGRCPALQDIPNSLDRLEPVALGSRAPFFTQAPGGGFSVHLRPDAPTYSIDAPGNYGGEWTARVRIETDGGPVQDWVEGTLAKLSDCWVDWPVDGKPAP